MGIFEAVAHEYCAQGLRVFPTGGPDGKVPCIQGWQKVGRKAVDELARKFPDANIGIPDGGAGITRIDIDDADLIPDALARFGETPVKVETPRKGGGVHLWYRANGERRRIGLDGEKIDVLGVGGFGVAPPSINPELGRAYTFAEGNIDDLARLPIIQKGALPPDAYVGYKAARLASHSKPTAEMVDGDGRNDDLFKRALMLARSCRTSDELLDTVMDANTGFTEPLHDDEVQRVAGSAWKYHVEGRNWVGGASRIAITVEDFNTLKTNPGALVLYMEAKSNHEGVRDTFALDTRKTPESLGWARKTFANRRDFLLDKGAIKRIHRGGNGPNDPDLFAFPDKGLKTSPNTNRHPSPLLPPAKGRQ